MAAGDAFLSAFLQVAFDRLASGDLIDFARQWRIDGELEKLMATLSEIQAVLNDAEEKQIKDSSVRLWLTSLTHLAYDVEDVLDEFATEALRSELVKEEEKTRGTAYQVFNFISSSVHQTGFKFGMSWKIKEIREKLEEVSERRRDLGLRESDGKSLIGVKQRSQTSSLVDESCVYGRESDLRKIRELLLSNEGGNSKVSVIPIVGMGGVGKTTLAQLLYNDEEVRKHFDLRAWASVSGEFDLIQVTKSILESGTKKSSDVKNLEPLQNSLEEMLSGNKFLIVLDDVWDETYNSWDVLRTPFRAGASGSKVIVTTRSKIVSSIVGTIPEAHHLKLLSDEDCWYLFAHLAFGSRNINEHPKLEVIGKKIVNKCGGLPLAAKTLGGLLRSKLIDDEWEDILKSKIWNFDDSEILPSLRLSYHHLPAHLKRCFAYCSIFPKDYEFEKEKLILLWMAEGFLQPKRGKRMEEIGDEYFRELLSRSFFQHSSCKEPVFVMHDLINDLAQLVAGETFFRLEGNSSCKVPKKARHSSYLRAQCDVVTKFEAFHEVKCLRTFLPLNLRQGSSNSCYLPAMVLHDLLPKLKFLRVLCLSGYAVAELPNTIGNLKHLRYFDLSYTKIERLPESVNDLYNLQTLILVGCSNLIELPKDMGNLINLRHLVVSCCKKLQNMPLRIGRMINLQTLPNFVVGENYGSGIHELRDMPYLRGELCIIGLENVVSIRDAVDANLSHKQYLHGLQLKWSDNTMDDSRNETVEKDVLNWLQPCINLRELTIECYGGKRFPSWIGGPSCVNFVFLKLQNCRKCELLPPLGQLPFLKDLVISGLDGIKILGPEFYGSGSAKKFQSLETLKFENMVEWEEWSGVEDEAEEEFPCLRELHLRYCPKLRSFYHCFPALVHYEIRGCLELTALPRLAVGNEEEEVVESICFRELVIAWCPKLRQLPSLPSLVNLEIYDCEELAELPRCPLLCKLDLEECDVMILKTVVDLSSLTLLRVSEMKLTHLPEEGFLRFATALKQLEITNCGELTALSEGVGLKYLVSLCRLLIADCPKLISLPREDGLPNGLEYLKIRNCHKLEQLPHKLPSMLRHLVIQECENLESLPMFLYSNTNLEKLKIEGCLSLLCFPDMGLPPMLKRLVIKRCERLKSLPDGILHNNWRLNHLMIEGCHSLTSFPGSKSLVPSTSTASTSATTKLKELYIWNCINLGSLPECLNDLTQLTSLSISRCPCLLTFPEGGLPATNLKWVEIYKCENLISLPDGIHEITTIQNLHISGCTNLVSFPEGGLPSKLRTLTLEDCEMWGVELDRLTSLRRLEIAGFPSLESFPEWLLPIPIAYLHIERLPNLKFISKRLQKLTSLESLEISHCPKLASFPEDHLPPMLHRLSISNCPLLARRCIKEEGKDWPKIAHIPRIIIDGRDII